eukprot:m.337178 g.337178  ORF g.337178 m.337178 type:complete len:148 (-) comp18069_c0_seq1:142-585(-)
MKNIEARRQQKKDTVILLEYLQNSRPVELTRSTQFAKNSYLKQWLHDIQNRTEGMLYGLNDVERQVLREAKGMMKPDDIEFKSKEDIETILDFLDYSLELSVQQENLVERVLEYTAAAVKWADHIKAMNPNTFGEPDGEPGEQPTTG